MFLVSNWTVAVEGLMPPEIFSYPPAFDKMHFSLITNGIGFVLVKLNGGYFISGNDLPCNKTSKKSGAVCFIFPVTVILQYVSYLHQSI